MRVRGGFWRKLYREVVMLVMDVVYAGTTDEGLSGPFALWNDHGTSGGVI